MAYIVILLMVLVPMVLVMFADFLERVFYPLDRVIYVCKRDGSHVVILTVVSSEMQNKRMKSHENHYSRKSKKIEW